MNIPSKILLLFSGGIDSATCLAHYRSNGLAVACLFINYGQSEFSKEYSAAVKLANYYSTQLERIDVTGFCWDPGYIPGRNLMLLSLALMKTTKQCRIISIGIHKNSDYPDCTIFLPIKCLGSTTYMKMAEYLSIYHL